MMRLTRKLYSEPEEKDDEETWKRNRNIGIVGAGTGALVHGIGRSVLNGKSKHSEKIREAMERAKKGAMKAGDETLVAAGKSANRLKTGGGAMVVASALAAGGSEIKRRKLKKKKNDEDKA